MEQRQFPVSLDSLPSILTFVHTYAEQKNLIHQTVYQLDTALEEVIANIIEHSALKKENTIDISCVADADGFHVTIEDQGIPFNPVAHAEKKNEREEDIGILMIMKLMDKVDYRYSKGKNILKLTKYTHALGKE